MKGFSIGIIVFVASLALFLLISFFAGSSRISVADEVVVYFQEQVIQKGVSRVGQPIEGFNALLLKNAFPGLRDGDFDRVVTREGVYRLEGGVLHYKRSVKTPITSAEEMITKEGYAQLLHNLLIRYEITPPSMIAVDRLLLFIDEPDIYKTLLFGYLHNDYAIQYGGDWYPVVNGKGVVLTRNRFLISPDPNDLTGFSPYILVTSENNVPEYSPFAKTLESAMTIGGNTFVRLETEMENGEEIVRYIYADGIRAIVLAHYPYDLDSSATATFEKVVQTFLPAK
ncbi:MAG: hypothetical protein WD003_01770 [Candidatus Paceibacterota bacterium]